MSVYNHRPMVPNNPPRLLELLDAIKVEYDQLSQEAQITKSQRDEYEHKVNAQIQEMNVFQQTLLDLERTQQVVKKQYEEEIARLRQQLDQLGGGYSTEIKPPPPPHVTSIPRPPITSSNPEKSAPTPPFIGLPISQQFPNYKPSSSNIVLNDIDPESVPANMKVEGQDWFALFNPKVPRFLKVDLVHSFDHNSVVCCVKFSLDGRYLATGCNQATYIYDTVTSQRIAVLRDETTSRDGDLYIRSVSFSPDGKYLATGAEDRRIRIWDITKSRIRCVLSGHEQDIYSLEFSRDGKILVSGSGDRTTRIWDWGDAQCLHVLRINDVVEQQNDPGVTSIAISGDSRLIAAGSLDRVVRIWDAVTGNLLEKLEGHKDSVYSVAFMPDNKSLVSASLDKKLKLWQLNSRSKQPCIQTFSGHKDFVLSVATTPDDRWIISGSKDRSVQFWDPRTGQPQFMLQGHKNSVISVAASPGRRPLFATGSGDNRARIWSYEPLAPS